VEHAHKSHRLNAGRQPQYNTRGARQDQHSGKEDPEAAAEAPIQLAEHASVARVEEAEALFISLQIRLPTMAQSLLTEAMEATHHSQELLMQAAVGAAERDMCVS
jgi:hypothetical protein